MSAEHLFKDGIISLNGTTVLKLTGMSLEINKETVDVTNIDSPDAWREMLVDLKDWSVNFDGLTVRQNTDWDYEELLTQLIQTSNDVAFVFTDTSNGVTTTIGGNVFLTNLPNTGSIGDKQTFSGSFTGNGGLTIGTSEAQAVINRMSGLTALEESSIRDFVNAEVASGNYALYDEFYCFGLGGTNALTGFKSKTATAVNAPTFDVNGATFDGATNYIDSNFNPSTDAVNYSLDNALAGAFVKEAAPDGGFNSLIGISGVDTFLITDTNTNAINLYPNAASPIVVLSETIQAGNLYMGSRVSNSQSDIYKNGVSVASGVGASTVLPNDNFFVASRGLAQFLDCTISTFQIGGAIGFDQAAHNTNLTAFLTALGTI